eukprot:627216-Amphidinium_carterae.1
MLGGLRGRSARQLIARVMVHLDSGDSSPLYDGSRSTNPLIGQLDIAKYFNGVDTIALDATLDRLGLGDF